MPRNAHFFTDKLNKLEEEKAALITKRRAEIAMLVEKVGYLALEDELLVGMILFLKEQASQDPSSIPHETKSFLEEMRAKGSHFFRRKPKPIRSSKKPNSKAA